MYDNKKHIIESIVKLNLLGRGSFADVYWVKFEDQNDDQIYAAKYYNSSTDEKHISQSLHREIEILSKLNHPTVI